MRDVVGEIQEQADRFKIGIEDFLRKIRKLKADDIVLLSPDMDGICDSCAIGRHCSIEFGELDNRMKGSKGEDETLLEGIELLLKEGGYKQGLDWDKSTIQLQRFDPGSTELNDPTVLFPFVKSYDTFYQLKQEFLGV